MTRDEARALFSTSGVDWLSAVTKPNMRRLISLIDARMVASGCIDGTLRMRRVHAVHPAVPKPWAALRCYASYFGDREAVTFNQDGFIGFAGWADSINAQPILDGFANWIREMASARESA